MELKKIVSDLEWIFSALSKGVIIENDDGVLKAIPKAINMLNATEEQKDKDMDKMRIENAELIQRVLQLEKELSKERAYNYAIVTVIKNNYPT